MMYYQQAEDLFKTARNKDIGKPIANNTRLVKILKPTSKGIMRCYGIKLYNTIVVEITPENHYILNTGNFMTLLTRERINNYMPGFIVQKNSIWYYSLKGYWNKDTSKETIFFEGMIIDDNGNVVNSKDGKPKRLLEQTKKEIDKLVRQYVIGYVDSCIERGEVNVDTNKDCFLCSGLLQEKSSDDHLLLHMKERYYVPSIVLNALKERGYNNIAIVIGMINRDLKSGQKGFHLEHALTRYFRKRKMDFVNYLIDSGKTVVDYKPEKIVEVNNDN